MILKVKRSYKKLNKGDNRYRRAELNKIATDL